MTINKLLTTINYENTNNTGRIKYIVIHYVGATGGAEANCKYFQSTYRGSSAHYFVGHSGEIWQCVDDADVAWHCGAKSYKHANCRNSNSIGIEMCCKKNISGNWYFEDATVNAAIELTKELMKKYNVPVSNVIRHYDVTGKNCPEPYVRDTAAWNNFKNGLLGSTGSTSTGSTGSFTVEILISDLNIRSNPSMSGAVVGQTGKGTFTIVEEKDGWGKLKSGAGWIYLGNPEYVKSTSYKVKITADVLNVRAGAGTGYKVNTTVKQNEVYTIVDESNGWGKLKSGAGWINLSYTKKV